MSQFTLLKSKRFLPFFVTQFLGAFNDNIFKNTLMLIIAYTAIEQMGGDLLLVVCGLAENGVAVMHNSA